MMEVVDCMEQVIAGFGRDIALFVIGHQESENAGIKYLSAWIIPLVSDIPVCYLESGALFDPAEL